MALRSPGYPAISLAQAIELIRKLYGQARANPVDREAAAKDMGFAGITGSSTKALADLSHYGLIEKAGKGAIRVSQRAVAILYGSSEAEKYAALREAAFAPSLFNALQMHFQDGAPSENALKSYLMRQQFASAAIPAVVASYLETCRLLQRSAATESHSQGDTSGENARGAAAEGGSGDRGERVVLPVQPIPPPANRVSDGGKQVTGERELVTGSLSKGAGFRLIVHGKIGEKELERLIRKLQLEKEIIADSDEEEDQSDLPTSAIS